MSGGSYDYLYSRLGHPTEYARMAAALVQAGHHDVAAVTLLIAALLTEAERVAQQLAEVHKAQEWRESGDSGPEEVLRAVQEWQRARARERE